MRYRPEIDGLRALAILPVIWFHAHLPGLPGGFAGVDVFFVISGFLITSLILSELAAGRFSVLHFYERRARRLLPALVLVVVACLPFAWLFMTPDQMEAFGRSVLSVALFASNIEFWQMTGYFAPSTAEIPLLHTWSLAVEEQFYLIFPPLLIVIWRVCPARLALILAIGCALSFAAALLLYRVGWGAAAFYLLPTRGWELLVGALAALWVRKHGLVERYAEGLAWIGLLALIVSYLGLDKFKPWPGPYTLLPVLGTCALLIALRPEGRLTRVLSSPVPVLIGLISYGAYLWHQPLFAFARLARLEAPSPMAMFALSCAALLLAWLSWRYVEQPIRRGVRISRQRVFTGSAVALTALLSLGAFGVVRHGLPERFSPEVVAILETATPAPHRASCHGIPSALTDPSEACVLGKGPPRWAVLGDSHGVELSYALAEQLERKGEGLVQLTASGCPPALTFRSRSQGCSEWHERSVRWLEDNPEIAHIILVYRHGGHLYGKNEVPVSDRVSAVLSGKSDQERERIYWASFETMLQRLASPGRQITVLASIPELGVQLPKLTLNKTPEIGAEARITILPEAARAALQDTIHAKLLEFSILARVVDPTAVLCPDQQCLGAYGGRAFYFDSHHLSIEGARFLAAKSKLIGMQLPDRGHDLVSQPSQNIANSFR